MFYMKHKGKKLVISEDNVFTVCPRCGREHPVDLQDILAGGEADLYTDAQNVKSGSWWCGDTALTPGQWTRVDLTKAMKPLNVSNQPIFEQTPNGFVYRFMNAPKGTVFYVTSLYAGTPAEETPVTITTTNCTIDQDTCYPRQTVTLTAQVPEGMVFDYFAVNGKKLDGNTFTVEADTEYAVEAVCKPANKVLNSAAWAPSLGANNGSAVVESTDHCYDGESSALKVTAAGSDNGVFLPTFDFTGYDYAEFYVYTEAAGAQAGSWWCADTALAPGQWTKIRVPLDHANLFLKNPADNGEIKPNQGDKPAPVGRLVVRLMSCSAGNEFWVSSVTAGKLDTVSTEPQMVVNANVAADKYSWQHNGGSAEYTTEKTYTGGNALVRGSESGTLKVTVNGAEASVGVYGAVVDSISQYDQVYFYVYTDAENVQSGGWWCGDTALTPGQWTRVDLTKAMKPQNVSGKSIFEDTPDGFAYRFMKAPAGTVFYVTSLYAGTPSEQTPVTVTTTNCTTDQDTYFPGQTVTLTAQVPEGMVFDYFTLNGEKLDGNTFTVEADTSYSAEAVCHAASKQVLGISGGAVSSADGTCSGAYTNEKVYDGGNPLVRNSDSGSLKVAVTSGNDAAIYVGGASAAQDIGMYDQVYYYAYTEDSGVVAGGWWCGDTALTPGQWTRVVLPKVPANSYSTTPWNKDSQPIFENGAENFVYRFQGAEGKTVYVTSLYAGPAYEQSPVALTLTACTAEKANYYPGQTVQLTANPAEAGWAFDHFEVNGEAITGNTFQVESGKTYDVKAVYRAVPKQVFAISGVTVSAASQVDSAEYVTDKVYDGGNALVRSCDSGSMKVTVTGGEAAILATLSETKDISAYDELYFYVYTEAANVRSGSWWCGDTNLIPGQWTKVRLTKGMNLVDSANNQIFDGACSTFYYRFMDAPAGTVFYVTSLYAGPASEQTPVTITLEGCTMEKEHYYPGQEVALTANAPEEGKVFSHFLVNDALLEGSTFTVEADNTYTVKAVYTDAPATASMEAPVTLTVTGCTTDKESYLPGETVTLKANDPAEGKIFSHFTVNDEKLEGNSFEVKAGITYTVKAVYSEKPEADNGEPTQVTAPAAEGEGSPDEVTIPVPESEGTTIKTDAADHKDAGVQEKTADPTE